MHELNRLLDYSEIFKNKKEFKKKLLSRTDLVEKKFAILCGSTLGVIKDFLELYLLYYGIKPVFWEGNYNRFYEDACFDNKELKIFNPDFIFIHITNKNLLINMDSYTVENQEILVEEKERLDNIWRGLEKRYHCSIIQNNFEYFPYRIIGNAARVNKDGNIKYIDDINNYLSNYVSKKKNFYINDIHYLSSYVGLINWYDARMWNMYKYPISMSVMPRYALSIANIVKSVLGCNKKAVITDLDNTLWGGTIGEIGVDGIKLGSEMPQGEGYCEFQKYLKQLEKHGILLNICSKNEYEIGMSGLRSTRSVLKENDFVLKKINWKNKPENVNEIINELNILPDSVIFLDDNIVECESVKAIIPEVEVFQIDDVYETIQELESISFFEETYASEEDTKRKQYYQQAQARNQEKQQFESYDKYLESLHMSVQIDSINDNNIQRVVQLFNKTNQFNFTTRRFTIGQMKEMCRCKEIISIVLSLSDKYGDNGIISVALIKIGKEAHITDWIMSCRVFERGLEYLMLQEICQKCIERNIETLYGYYYKTQKNQKIENFYQNLLFENENERWRHDNIEQLLQQLNKKNIYISRKGLYGENIKSGKQDF